MERTSQRETWEGKARAFELPSLEEIKDEARFGSAGAVQESVSGITGRCS